MPSTPETPMSGCLLRFFWAFAGPAILAIIALVIATNKLQAGCFADCLFAAIVAAMIAARVLESTPPTEGGATSGSIDVGVIRPGPYTVMLLAFGLVLLLAAHLLLGRFFA